MSEKIVEHPNVALRREIDALKKKLEAEISLINQSMEQTAKALMLLQEKHNQMHSILMRCLLKMEALEEKKTTSRKKTL